MEKMISAIKSYAAALNALDVEAYLNCFSEDAIVIDPYGSPPAEGEVGLRRWFGGMTRTWRTFDMSIRETYASGGRVAARWEVEAQSKAGAVARFAGINVFTIDESGQITRLEGYWDVQAMMRQIG